MMKKLAVLAVAASLGSLAHADSSNVNVYGVMDAYVGSFNAKGGQHVSGVHSNGLTESRLGLKGTEDLGNGMKAVFALEMGPLSVDSADNGLATSRQAYVGLTDARYGSLTMGTLRSPASDWSTSYSALAGSAFDPMANGAKVGFGIQANDRLDNAVSYVAPSVAGVTPKLTYAQVNEGPTAATRMNVVVASADWQQGPLAVGGVYREVSTDHGQREFGIGAAYTLPQAKLMATYQQRKAEGVNSAVDRLYGVSAVVPVSTRANVIGSASYLNAGRSSDAVAAYTVAYTYDLSKRTTVYAAASYADGKNVGANMGDVTAVPVGDASGVGGGLRVAF